MATIKDVAKKANVSVATVSRVINDKGNVNLETQALVENAIKELNYIPNQLARSLYLKKSKLLAIIIPHFGTDFYCSLVEGIENAAIKEGYKIILCSTQDNPKRELEYIKMLKTYSIDGIILASNALNPEEFIKTNLPIVTVDHILSENIPSVTSNNLLGGQMAAHKLICAGTKLALEIQGPGFLLTMSERSIGFQQVLIQNNIPFITIDDDLISPNKQKIEQILTENPKIDSIFAASDFLALTALKVVQKMNKRVPEDIQIIGFDDVPYAALFSPSLTTVSQPIKKMGEYAIETLINILNKKELPQQHKVFDINLIHRESTR